MPPKAKKGAPAQKSKTSEDEREEPLQAVVFADAFETTFVPFTLERPRVRDLRLFERIILIINSAYSLWPTRR